MAETYKAVGWNRQKRLYDLVIAAGCLIYLTTFAGLHLWLRPNATAETVLLRGTATLAFLLLHVVLSIGPLARLDRRFLPLLYNRRHLGVSLFFVALAHAVLATVQFHTQGPLNPVVSILAGYSTVTRISDLPFQTFGLAALIILFLMAATSHDFWLNNLTAPTWKRLHMLVYLAYPVLIGHVALGFLQSETHWMLAGFVVVGMAWLVTIHLIAGIKELKRDKTVHASSSKGYVRAGCVSDIPDRGAIISNVAGERVAVFRNKERISAVSNVCQHQNGPLGEGRIIDGWIVCPWHGYQYCPETGRSPEPFTEKIPTFDIEVREDASVWIAPSPNAPGMRSQSATVPLRPDSDDKQHE